MRLHPVTQILIWCVFVTAMQFLAPKRIFIAATMVLLSAFLLSRHKLIHLLRRTRWIMLSLWFIYAYSTPGEPLFDLAGIFSPSIEGVLDGGVQLMRLLSALAALSLLLNHLHRQQLIAGLYALFAPVVWLGLSRERLAVRLALTLQYAEVAMLLSVTWKDSLRSLTADFIKTDAGNMIIELPVCRFTRRDAGVLIVTATVLWQVVK